jgi:hypothetical protein
MIIEEINKLIDSYERSIESQNLSGLIALRDRLAINSYRLAQESSEFKRDYNQAYFIRKISINKSTQGFIANKKLPKNKAEVMSLIENEDIYSKEIELEAVAYQYDLLLRQVNKILEAMAQRISYLKTEKENVRG